MYRRNGSKIIREKNIGNVWLHLGTIDSIWPRSVRQRHLPVDGLVNGLGVGE